MTHPSSTHPAFVTSGERWPGMAGGAHELAVWVEGFSAYLG